MSSQSKTEASNRVFFAGGERDLSGAIIQSGAPEEIISSLQGDEVAVIVMPFDPSAPSLAHRVSPDSELIEVAEASPERSFEVRQYLSSEEYAERVSQARELIRDGQLDKVVLGRSVAVHATPPITRDQLLTRLRTIRPGKYVFAIPTEDGTVIGASPELLVYRSGATMLSHPLAGSIPRHPDAQEDANRAANLQQSPKDLHEHAFVTRQIVAALEPLSSSVTAPEHPEVLSTDTMWHLATPIEAQLLQPAPNAYELAKHLHPTAAVAGTPLQAALSVIADLESVGRGALAGVVGWCDRAGNGEFVLAIRSGVLYDDQLRLYSGAGIVADSDPAAEAREVSAKLLTMLRVVGADEEKLSV